MTIKGEHRGHCQVCGRIQVVLPSGNIAKHGYRVGVFHFFNGVCWGADFEPLQVSRKQCDEIAHGQLTESQRLEARAIALRGGVLKPERAQKLTEWGSRVSLFNNVTRKNDAVMLQWADASPRERAAQIELEAGDHESESRKYAHYAKSMRKLADEIHGTPVIDRAAEELAIIAKRQAKKASIEGAYRTKAAQKADLEKLNCEYSELRRDIIDTYLEKRDIKGEEVYWKLPDNLHAWRHIHSLLVLDAYPEHKPQVEAIGRLLFKRNEIRARPVIK